jgi:uncharacterized protein (UPF0335 family)
MARKKGEEPKTDDNQSGPTADVDGIAGAALKSFIERIERLQEEQRTLAADVREVFAEAKGNGFDIKTMRRIIRIRCFDKDDLDEAVTLQDVYLRALGMRGLEEYI